MSSERYFDISSWQGTDPHKDIGKTINEIIEHVHYLQDSSPINPSSYQGRPGATIHIPAGDWPLHTQININISYLRIEGEGHGFVSSSIRFNLPLSQIKSQHELWPGGSRIINLLPIHAKKASSAGAALLVKRAGNPRISSIEFDDFCIDGGHFTATNQAGPGTSDPNSENSYKNGKTGIWVDSPQDSFSITRCGFVYLERGIVIRQADALTVHNNFIAECGNCLEMLDWSQASKITDNLIGAGYCGHSIYIENGGGILLSANNIFPRGRESLVLKHCTRSSVTANRFNSFYPDMLDVSGSENLIAANHLYRSAEPWIPMQMHHSELSDSFGLLVLQGNDNTLVANHISIVLDKTDIHPKDTKLIAIRLLSGQGNKIMSNHVVAHTENAQTSEKEKTSAFKAQVGAVLTQQNTIRLPFISVQIDPTASYNTVTDSGRANQLNIRGKHNAYRPDPDIC